MFKRTNSGHLPTKDKITLATYVLLKRKPYRLISVSEICEKANISRMSFYRYYSSKDDIFLDFCDQRFEEFYEIIQRKNLEKVEDLILEIFTYIKQFSREIDKLKNAGLQYFLLKQFESYVKYIVKSSKNEKLTDALNNKIFSPFIAGGVFMAVITWGDNSYKDTPEEISKLTMDVLTIK